MTLKDFEDCLSEATRLTKITKGHTFQGGLRAVCLYCGRTDKIETRCQHEVRTFSTNLTRVLLDNGTINPHSRN